MNNDVTLAQLIKNTFKHSQVYTHLIINTFDDSLTIHEHKNNVLENLVNINYILFSFIICELFIQDSFY